MKKTGHADSTEGAGSLKRTMVDLIITTFIGVALAVMAHWLLGEEYASRQQARILAPIAGYFYGHARRDDITVLLIDDASLAGLHMKWPAPYGYEARLLHAIGRYNPRAVFVDIYFEDNREAPDIGQLVAETCALKARGTAVYLGTVKGADNQFHLREEFEREAGKCFTKVALTYTPDEIDKTAWSYPVAPHMPAALGGEAISPAAVAIYNGLAKAPLAPGPQAAPLALTWGSQQARHGIAWTVDKDGVESTERYCRPYQGVREMIPGALRQYGIADHEKPICVFHETLLAQDLAARSGEEEKLLDARLRDKIVLIGVALRESKDQITSPLHGRIPGVYLHAMALDNLLTYQAGYPEEVGLRPETNRSHLKLFLFLFCSILVISYIKKAIEPVMERWDAGPHQLLEDLHAKASRRPASVRRTVDFMGKLLFVFTKILGKLLILILGTLATGAVALIGASLLHIGFLSTFSVAIFVVAAEWLEIKEKLTTEYLPNTMHSVS